MICRDDGVAENMRLAVGTGIALLPERAYSFALAKLPPQPIEQGMVGPGLLTEVIVKKFDHHVPLYRQEKIFKQQYGVELSRKTLGSWVEQAAELLAPDPWNDPPRSLTTTFAPRLASSRA